VAIGSRIGLNGLRDGDHRYHRDQQASHESLGRIEAREMDPNSLVRNNRQQLADHRHCEHQPGQPADYRDQSNEEHAVDGCEQRPPHRSPGELIWKWIAPKESQSQRNPEKSEQQDRE
jgi:hypothetical protein